MKTYLVGGAVRDTVMGIEPKDRDWVIVGATENDVLEMLNGGFSRVGADFPVFLHPETGEEYALARVERKIGTGYHGFETQTAGVTLEDDLARRDLTVNAMAMGADGVIIDPFNGQQDIKNKVLRHTTVAFSEDPLRVLRVARFAARWKWSIAEETLELCNAISASGALNDLSNERIWIEIKKGFEGDVQFFLQTLHDVGAIAGCQILAELFSSANRPSGLVLEKDLFDIFHQKAIKKNYGTSNRFAIAFAMNANPIGPVQNNDLKFAVQLLHAFVIPKLCTEKTEDLLEVLRFAKCQIPDGKHFNLLLDFAELCYDGDIRELLQQAARAVNAVNAEQFIASGMKPGPELGKAIRQNQIRAVRAIANQLALLSI